MKKKNRKRKALIVTESDINADGVMVFLDEFDTREKAEEALFDSLLEYIDYGIKEVEINES